MYCSVVPGTLAAVAVCSMWISFSLGCEILRWTEADEMAFRRSTLTPCSSKTGDMSSDKDLLSFHFPAGFFSDMDRGADMVDVASRG